jgi:hypothetical protein
VTHARRHARERAIATFRVINPAVIDQFLLYLREIKQSWKLKYNFHDAESGSGIRLSLPPRLNAILSPERAAAIQCDAKLLLLVSYLLMYLIIYSYVALFLRCRNTYKEPGALCLACNLHYTFEE